MSQLLLFAPRATPAVPTEQRPDARHAWAIRSSFARSSEGWRCLTCGELALPSADDAWAFLSAESGPDQWGTESHACESRAEHG
jgi:hypothetical protein